MASANRFNNYKVLSQFAAPKRWEIVKPMIEFEKTAIIVTARMAGAGLAGLPMVDVSGQTLVARAAANVEKAGLGTVLVATPDNQVAEALRKQGRDVLVAPARLESLTAMAAHVLSLRDGAKKFTHVLVLPCNLATIDALSLRRCLAGLDNDKVDGATLAGPVAAETIWHVDAPLSEEREVAWLRGITQEEGGAAHIPVYAWTRAALEKFAAGPMGAVAHELAHALQLGLRIAAVKVDSAPLNVDTPQALEALRRLMKA